MKRFLSISALAVLGLVLLASSKIAENDTQSPATSGKTVNYMVSNEESSINWEGGKITGSKHIGTLEIKESSLSFDGKSLVGGSFTIDMNSIKSTDLEGNSAAKLEGHLKSDDFFGISNHPYSTFNIKDVKPGNESDGFIVTGNLTIKSTTLPISFPVNLAWSGDKVIATGMVKIDRTDFDVRYGSGRFFDGLGDKAIKDEFTLDVTIVSGMQAY